MNLSSAHFSVKSARGMSFGRLITGEKSMTASVDHILAALAALATPRMKKYYLAQGVREPVYGAPTGAMKPIARPINGNQPIAETLYATGIFDAMYLAGMICAVETMTPADFRRWMDQAYCAFIAEAVVAVSLAETAFAQPLAAEFMASPSEAIAAGGWSCYEWLLGARPDHEFTPATIQALLDAVPVTIASQPRAVQSAMQRVVVAVGVSYRPLHAEALHTATQLQTTLPTPVNQTPATAIERAVAAGRVGFKRRHVRC